MNKTLADKALIKYQIEHTELQSIISKLLPNESLLPLWYWLNGQHDKIHKQRCKLGVEKKLLWITNSINEVL